jgi:anti-sigma factor RsiW
VFSQYLDGELAPTERRSLEAHLLDCHECRRDLASLSQTIDALGALPAEPGPQLADAVIDALRLEGHARDEVATHVSNPVASPALRVIGGAGQQPRAEGTRRGASARVRPLLRYCLRRAQLRLTLPMALLAGAAISLINQGGMILNGDLSVGMCVMCALNFLVPFIALNISLAMATGLATRRRI